MAKNVEQNGPIRRKKINWPLIITSILAVLILIIGTVLWIALTFDTIFIDWGPSEITFYSNEPINNYGEDSFFKNHEIDNGFNDSTFDGVEQYSKWRQKNIGKENYIGVNSAINFSNDYTGYINDNWGIDAQYRAGTKTLISSGFNISKAFEFLYQNDEYFSDVDNKLTPDINEDRWDLNNWTSIVLDDANLALNHKSAISVEYNSNEVGFLSGLAASTYTTYKIYKDIKNGEVYNDDIVIWGGSSYETVYDWLSGFEQGVNYFNYIVLGVGVNDKTYYQSNDTLGLVSELDLGSTDLVDGLDLTNGYDLIPNYNSSFVTNNSNLSNIDANDASTYENLWYLNSFDFDIDSTAGKIAIDRTMRAIENDVSVLFPVAGGQTKLVSSILKEQIGEMYGDKSTRIIGIDVDGTQSDESNKNFYLGSAVKNLSSPAALSLWTTEGKKSNPTFNGVKGKDFITENTKETPNGWKVSEVNGEKVKGNLYKGTYQNGGVSFAKGVENTNNKTLIDYSYDYIVDKIKKEGIMFDAPESFSAFLKQSLIKQFELVGGIESSSNTFTPEEKYNTHSTTSQITKWIPDWDIYLNLY